MFSADATTPLLLHVGGRTGISGSRPQPQLRWHVAVQLAEARVFGCPFPVKGSAGDSVAAVLLTTASGVFALRPLTPDAKQRRLQAVTEVRQ